MTNMKENIAKADRLMRDHDAKREVLVQSLRTRGDTLEKDLKAAKADHETAINKSVANMKATLAKADHLMREHDAKRDRQAQRLQECIRDLEKDVAAASVKVTLDRERTFVQQRDVRLESISLILWVDYRLDASHVSFAARHAGYAALESF